MKSVLFVCLGNICRSPLAEGILRHKANEKGIDLHIDSAGTESLHVGEYPDRRSVKIGKERGIDISRQVARQVKPTDFDKFDKILVADAQVYNELKRFARDALAMKKVDFMMNMLTPGSNTTVPDPYYGGQDGFEKVYDMLDRACDAILNSLKNDLSMKGTIYLIPVPISDEDDNSALVYPLLEQTVNTLSEFIVEDLKTSRRVLRKIGFKGEFDKMTFHVLNEHTDTKSIGNFLVSAEKGKNVGLLSEAGMPCIADPGFDIVRLAHSKGIKVVPLYGQSSIFLALAASGLNGQSFQFHGYLSKEQSERKRKLKELSGPPQPSRREGGSNTSPSLRKGFRMGSGCTHIFIETPYRNNHLLEDILITCSPETLLCVAMNVTGKSEMILTRSIAEWKRGELPNLDKQPTVFLLGR